MTKYNVLQNISVLSAHNSVLFWTPRICRNTVDHQLTKVGVLVLELLGAVWEHEVGVELPLVGELVVPRDGGAQLGAEHGDWCSDYCLVVTVCGCPLGLCSLRTI